jgi:hypothetical protein
MTTITLSVTAPTLKDITRGLSSDWGPTIHATARRVGVLVALAWTLCSMAADRWQQLVAWAQDHQLYGLARLGLDAGIPAPEPLDDHFGGANKMVVQRLAPVLPPARPAANVAPPRTGIIHISDPMARAVRMVREGKSQRLAAHVCGISRTSLQRALKA